MFKERNLTIAYAFHLVMILMFAWLIFKVQAAKEKAYASKVQQKMVGVASTFSVLPGRHTLEDLAKDRLLPAEQTEGAYRIAQEQLQQVLDANGISDFELSVIQYAPQQQPPFRLVSSNPIYALGETFHDLNGKALERFHLGHAERLSFDNGIQEDTCIRAIEGYAWRDDGRSEDRIIGSDRTFVHTVHYDMVLALDNRLRHRSSYHHPTDAQTNG
jgi:hypothetical protein